MKEKDDTHMPAAVSTDFKKSQQQGSSADSEILSQPRRKGLELKLYAGWCIPSKGQE